MSSTATLDHVRSILTPEVLLAALKAMTPGEKGQEADWKLIIETPTPKELRALSLEPLIELSKIGLDNMPDLMNVLPAPESPSFVEQALGLIALLDQGCQASARRTDWLWFHRYFTPLSLKLSKQFLALPADLQPHKLERWTAIDYTFSYWMVAANWFIAPFTHSGNKADINTGVELSEYFRKELEQHCGHEDPYRKDHDTDIKDLFAMPRIGRAGPPKSAPEDVVFWVLLTMDVKVPIVNEFGRMPWIMPEMGEDMTEDEKAYLKKTGHRNKLPDCDLQQIKKDFASGTWTPFGEASFPKKRAVKQDVESTVG